MATALANRNNGQGGGLASIVEGARDRLAAALPAHLTPERTAQLLTVIAYRTPKLAECTPESIITSLIQVASLDLDLTPGTNEAYLIPRWNGKANVNECQFQPGYKALEKLAVRTGAVLYIQPREVFAADHFEVWHEDDRTRFRHRPAFGKDRGDLLYIYAVAKMADGAPLIEVMTAEEIEDIHRRTEGYRNAAKYGKPESGPWATDWLAMGRKTVIRKLCKSLPRVVATPTAAQAFDRLNAAIEADNAQYADWQQIDPPAKPDNNSGFGQGMYASPADTETYLTALVGFLDKTNAEWFDKLSGVCRGDVPTTVKPLEKWQADNHLVKWAKDTGALDPVNMPDEAKNRQIGRFTAIVYHRSKADRKALANEMAAYAAIHWRRQLDALCRSHPDLAPAIAERWGEPDDAADDADGDPEFDYKPGAAG